MQFFFDFNIYSFLFIDIATTIFLANCYYITCWCNALCVRGGAMKLYIKIKNFVNEHYLVKTFKMAFFPSWQRMGFYNRKTKRKIWIFKKLQKFLGCVFAKQWKWNFAKNVGVKYLSESNTSLQDWKWRRVGSTVVKTFALSLVNCDTPTLNHWIFLYTFYWSSYSCSKKIFKNIWNSVIVWLFVSSLQL